MMEWSLSLTRSTLMSDDPLLPLLAVQLKDARESNGLSQAAAGQAIYRSDRKIRFIESGEQVPDLIEFLKLMTVYELDPAQFITRLIQCDTVKAQVEAHGSEQPVLSP